MAAPSWCVSVSHIPKARYTLCAHQPRAHRLPPRAVALLTTRRGCPGGRGRSRAWGQGASLWFFFLPTFQEVGQLLEYSSMFNCTLVLCQGFCFRPIFAHRRTHCLAPLRPPRCPLPCCWHQGVGASSSLCLRAEQSRARPWLPVVWSWACCCPVAAPAKARCLTPPLGLPSREHETP